MKERKELLELAFRRDLPAGQENIACFSQIERVGWMNSRAHGISLPVGQENVACFMQTLQDDGDDRQMRPQSTVNSRLARALLETGITTTVQSFPSSTRTAADAAQTVGCKVGQIVKSIVFRTVQTDQPILVLIGGDVRVSENLLAEVVGEKVEKASADYVREHTGYAIGGVPPLGHCKPLRTIIDDQLLKHDMVWAAAGTPSTVFAVATAQLTTVTGGEIKTVRI